MLGMFKVKCIIFSGKIIEHRYLKFLKEISPKNMHINNKNLKMLILFFLEIKIFFLYLKKKELNLNFFDPFSGKLIQLFVTSKLIIT